MVLRVGLVCFVVGVVLGWSAMARGADEPSSGRASVNGGDGVATSQPVFSVDDVNSGFLAHVAAGDRYDRQRRDFVLASRDGLTGEDRRMFVGEMLAVLSPVFKQGLDLLDEDEPGRAVEVLVPLSADDDPYLAVAAAHLAGPAMIELDRIDECQSMLERVVGAYRPVDRYASEAGDIAFMRGYCQVHNVEYEAAQATLSSFLRRYPNAPERLRVAAVGILTELPRRVPDGLGDVRDLLACAHRKIKNENTGESVKARQEEAIVLLDALIKAIEEKEKQSKCGGKKGDGKKDGGCDKPGGGGGPPDQGAKQSTLPGGEGDVGRLRKARAAPGEVWGKMPPKEREQVLQALQRQFPSRYRELLEQYYEQLAKDASGS